MSSEGPCILLIRSDGGMKRLAEIELEAIEFAIEHCDGNMSLAAQTLGIGRSTLYRKVREASSKGRKPVG